MTKNEPQSDKVSETCTQVDDHVFVKPAEPKSTVEPKDPVQTKDKVVSVNNNIPFNWNEN